MPPNFPTFYGTPRKKVEGAISHLVVIVKRLHHHGLVAGPVSPSGSPCVHSEVSLQGRIPNKPLHFIPWIGLVSRLSAVACGSSGSQTD
jgi:hypothetical protein